VHKDRNTRTLEVLKPLDPGVEFAARGRLWPYLPWIYCKIENGTSEPIFVYGPRHSSVESSLPTSLFMLRAGHATPDRWDCKGLLIPADRTALNGTTVNAGPIALKYRDFRRVRIGLKDGVYQCPRSNGVLPSGHVEFVTKEWTHAALLSWSRRPVEL